MKKIIFGIIVVVALAAAAYFGPSQPEPAPAPPTIHSCEPIGGGQYPNNDLGDCKRSPDNTH